MPGHYSFTLAEPVTRGHLRPLEEESEKKLLPNVSLRSTELSLTKLNPLRLSRKNHVLQST